jgi:hypothetical protein
MYPDVLDVVIIVGHWQFLAGHEARKARLFG